MFKFHFPQSCRTILEAIFGVGNGDAAIFLPYIPVLLIPFKNKFSKGTIKVLVWGGLRGGVSIALALSINENPYKAPLIAATYFVVVFSIIVQGLTVGKVASKALSKEEE